MEKTLILIALAALAILFTYQYRTNKQWEELLVNKQGSFNQRRSLKRRKSKSYMSAAAFCFVAMAGVSILPQNLAVKDASMGADIRMMESGGIDFEESDFEEDETVEMAEDSFDATAEAADEEVSLQEILSSNFADLYTLEEETELSHDYEVREVFSYDNKEYEIVEQNENFYLNDNNVFYHLSVNE